MYEKHGVGKLFIKYMFDIVHIVLDYFIENILFKSITERCNKNRHA